jgi:hypothetical protein
MSYLVPAGLYALGNPCPDDPVVVTANYKMSYDIVRRELNGRNIWLLALETNGINVWCAAGKGTFGTAELVKRIDATGLSSVVNHRLLLLPVLGAAGVSAHEVSRLTGFRVHYSTIRASDLPEFLDNGMKTNPDMRELTFSARERLVLTPVEIVSGFSKSLPLLALLFFLGAFSKHIFSLSNGIYPVIVCCGAILAGTFAAPVLLPWLPSRYFSVKGAAAGIFWILLLFFTTNIGWNTLRFLADFFLIIAVSSFFAMNFTGSTPFTSPSGVRKEMRLFLPLQAAALVTGIVFLVADILAV